MISRIATPSVDNVASVADTASVPGGIAGLFSLETSQIPSAVSHRVRHRRAVDDGGQVDGNGLPRFGSLSYSPNKNVNPRKRRHIA